MEKEINSDEIEASALRIFKSDIVEAERLRDELDSDIDIWKDEYIGCNIGTVKKNKSSVVSKDIKRQVRQLTAESVAPFVNNDNIIKAYPVTEDDVESAKKINVLLNYRICREFDLFKFLNEAVMLSIIEGTAFIKLGWEIKTKKTNRVIVTEDEAGNVSEEYATEIIYNRPVAKICLNQDILFDPTCEGDMDKCDFICHRFQTSLNQLRREPRKYKNIDKIDISLNSTLYGSDMNVLDTTNFETEDKDRKKIVLYEYWGYYDIHNNGNPVPIVCSWVGDTVVRFEENPYPDKKQPFLILTSDKEPFDLTGRGIADEIGDEQKIKTGILRGMIDNLASSNNGQIGIRTDTMSPSDEKKMANGENYHYFGNPSDIVFGRYNEFPSSLFNMLSLMDNYINETIGTQPENTRGNQYKVNIRKKYRLSNIVNNLIKPLARRWLSFESEFGSPEQQLRITENEFEIIKVDDLNGKIDISIEVNTIDDDNKEAEELAMMAQTIGNLNENIAKKLLSEVFEIRKKPRMAKEILQINKHEPSETEQMMAQLEVQMAQARLKNEVAKAGENETDIQLKRAKTQLELAKTKYYSSYGDLNDLDFIRKEGGIELQEKKDLELTKRHERPKLED